jgi:hypothetical protein
MWQLIVGAEGLPSNSTVTIERGRRKIRAIDGDAHTRIRRRNKKDPPIASCRMLVQ